jgi:RNA polymerase subunit RPABC4/transcription elongation factor Spt4
MTTDTIPLGNAFLCQDCHRIGESAKRCPSCTSSALLGLAGVLNRESDADMAKRILAAIEQLDTVLQ